MKNITLKKVWALLLILFLFCNLFSQSNYKIASTNYVLNSDFQNSDPNNSINVTNWTFNPAGDSDLGWKKDIVLIYGSYLFIDRFSTSPFVATPTLSAVPCTNAPKIVKFYYNGSNTGSFDFQVKLGGAIVAKFGANGLNANSLMTLASGVTATVERKFISEGFIASTDPLWGNVWHEVTLYVPSGSGALTFEYLRNSGISKQIRLDNVEYYDALLTPVPTVTSIAPVDCNTNTANLDSVKPAAPAGIIYTWYSDATHTNAVATTTAAPVGTYYLFATSTCTGANYSNPSAVVTIQKPTGCCGTNVIQNGTFDTFTNSGTNGDNPANWTMNPTGTWATRDIGTYLGGTTVLKIDSNISTYSTISQSVKACPGEKLSYGMSFGMETVSLTQQNRTVDVKLGSLTLFVLNIYKNSIGGLQVAINNINSAVTNLKINGTSYIVPTSGPTANGYSFSGFSGGTILNASTLYSLTADIAFPSSEAANPTFLLGNNEGAVTYVDNISIINQPPTAESPTSASASANCTTGTFDLTTVQPTTANRKYEWHTANNALASTLVANPKSVKPGTYYLHTKSTCSSCESTSLTAFTVTTVCPTVNGKVFADYDGPSNGVNNTGAGQSGGGLYALLVDNVTGNVVNSIKVNTDGTYSLRGITTGTYYVMLNNKDVAAGTAAPATATLNPNYLSTGEAISSVNDGLVNAKSATFSLTGGASPTTQNNVDFGLNSPPIAADASSDLCEIVANTNYTIPTLYGLDDSPTFNNGVGQKIIIKTVNNVNGTLKYNGVAVTNNFTISSYSPALLVFTSNVGDASSANFTYIFVDAMNVESQISGIVRYSFTNPTITGASSTVIGNNITLTGSGPTVSDSWSSSNTAVATINAATGVITPISAGSTVITYKNGYGCTITKSIRIFLAACTKPATIDNGNTYPSNMGITSLGRAGSSDINSLSYNSDNWPMVRQSAQLVLESKTKGFVINRVAADSAASGGQIPTSVISNPVKGMMVYDTTNHCLKIYDGTSWKCFTTAACPY